MLADLQRLLVQALLQPDPRAWIATKLRESDCALSAAERQALASLSEDGLRLTRMLVRKLRLQRLLGGDPDAAAACTNDSEAFAKQFAAYDAAIAPTAVFPSEEAAQFRRWRAGT